MASKVKGAVVFVGEPTRVPFVEVEPAKRRVDADVKAQYQPDPNAPAAAGRGGRAGGPAGGRGAGAAAPAAPTGPARLTAAQVSTRVNEWLVASGAALRLNDAGMSHGKIRAFNFAGYDATQDGSDGGAPQRGLRAHRTPGGRRPRREAPLQHRQPDLPRREDLVQRRCRDRRNRQGRRSRDARRAPRFVAFGHGRHGQRDRLRRDDGSRPHPQGDRRQAAPHDSRGPLGRRGAGPARLEGVRRTALRDGGESEAGVCQVQRLLQRRQRHGPDSRRVGLRTARSRRRSSASTSVSSRISASSARSRRTSRASGGTDSTSFNAAGLPGIGLGQDPIEYNSATWHTNLDTYERIVEDDVKKSAIAIASAVYHVAMRDEMLPRFTPAAMPPSPGQPAAPAARRSRSRKTSRGHLLPKPVYSRRARCQSAGPISSALHADPSKAFLPRPFGGSCPRPTGPLPPRAFLYL